MSYRINYIGLLFHGTRASPGNPTKGTINVVVVVIRDDDNVEDASKYTNNSQNERPPSFTKASV